jgi:hypothetical protein
MPTHDQDCCAIGKDRKAEKAAIAPGTQCRSSKSKIGAVPLDEKRSLRPEAETHEFSVMESIDTNKAWAIELEP